MKKISKTVLAALLGAALAFAVSAAVFVKFAAPLMRLRYVEAIIEKDYIGEFDAEKAENAAIDAVIESMGDKYAAYYDEESARTTFEKIDGYYTGVGMEIMADTEKDRLVVVSAYEDTPAYRAGIKSGDVITTIDEKTYGAKDLVRASEYMQGTDKKAADAEISIEIMRGEERLIFKMKREKISLYRVKCETVDDKTAYIKYSGFTENSEKELEKAISELPKNIDGVVLDLRNNPGGEFGSAIDMCDYFLDGKEIMYTVDNKNQKTVYKAHDGACNIKLAVVVNESSASAAEIFAGSMKANKRAVTVGSKTFGKGVSQTIRYLNPLNKKMGAIKLTTCNNYTPDGKSLNEGVVPDIEIQNSDIAANREDDEAYIAAVKALSEKE